jgi:hypothetical protein
MFLLGDALGTAGSKPENHNIAPAAESPAGFGRERRARESSQRRSAARLQTARTRVSAQ